jgi:hypothetical protein
VHRPKARKRQQLKGGMEVQCANRPTHFVFFFLVMGCGGLDVGASATFIAECLETTVPL